MKKEGSALAYFLFAITFIAIGVCFIGFTSASINAMCYMIGGVTLFAAAFNAVIALSEKKRGGAFYLKMLLCVFAVICGVVILVNREVALEYIVAAAAFLLVIETSFKLQTAVRGRTFKAPLWWAIVVMVVICYFGEGYLLKFYIPDSPKLMVGILGALLILDGVLNLLTPPYLHSIRKREEKEAQEANTEKESKIKKKDKKKKERDNDDDSES